VDAFIGQKFCIRVGTRNLYFAVGKISGAVAKTELVKSRLPNSILGKVWKLSDLDHDGMLDVDEFALAMYLTGLKMDGFDLPNELPPHLLPPSKRFN